MVNEGCRWMTWDMEKEACGNPRTSPHPLPFSQYWEKGVTGDCSLFTGHWIFVSIRSANVCLRCS